MRGSRITYPHAVFHVINRFVDRHPFFKSPEDYGDFLRIYFEESSTFGIWTYAYDLLPNHFHIVLETPTGEISRFLQRFLTRAARHLNLKCGRVGHLFQGRSKTLLVETDGYFETVVGYVLLNGVRAKLAKSVFNDRWNSVGEMLSLEASRLARGPLWGYLFGREIDERDIRSEVAICRNWLRRLDVGQNEDKFVGGHHGSFLSSESFRKRILAKNERRRGIVDGGMRRKTDRHKKEWSWTEMGLAAEKVAGQGSWSGVWKNRLTAVRHVQWYVAYAGAGWTLNRIRECHDDRGAPNSRYAMAITKIRNTAAKHQLAEKAIRLCMSANPK